jgi:hypothetical protein
LFYLVSDPLAVRVEQRVPDEGECQNEGHNRFRRQAMHKNLLRHTVRWGLVSVCLCTMIDSTTAGSFTRGCAARDLQILMLIEERENADAVSPEKLSDAMLSMLEARIVCYQGRVMDAMTLYDSITQSITPDTFLSARRK